MPDEKKFLKWLIQQKYYYNPVGQVARGIIEDYANQCLTKFETTSVIRIIRHFLQNHGLDISGTLTYAFRMYQQQQRMQKPKGIRIWRRK